VKYTHVFYCQNESIQMHFHNAGSLDLRAVIGELLRFRAAGGD
jgi:hypothetical protein